MLTHLTIRNFALIDDMSIDLSDGLTVITGETGAGKSILLSALGLLMGNRADTKVMHNTSQKCLIEGEFKIAEYNLKSVFEENDWDYDPICILRREITTSGKSRAFINDSPCNLSDLKELSTKLITIHNQFDTLQITTTSYQTKTIDAYSDNLKHTENYTKFYEEYSSSLHQLDKLRNEEEKAQERVDFLNFQLNEIEALSPKPDEEKELETVLNKAQHSETLVQNLYALDGLVRNGENSIDQTLAQISKQLHGLGIEDEKFQSILKRLDETRIEFSDLAEEAVDYSESISSLDINITEIEERLDRLNKIMSKHRVFTSSELLDKQNEMQHELETMTGVSASIASLESKIKTIEKDLDKICKIISTNRQTKKSAFEKEVISGLAHLSMDQSQFEVGLESLDRFTSYGNERVSFLFSANPGFALQTLDKVASGGEMSRLALVLQSLLADYVSLPTMIFDEIDSGVSGNVAAKMGDILASTAENHQMIVITHSPQVAALADEHLHVVKEVDKGVTHTRLRKLSDKERTTQIAILLSTDPPTDSAIQNAKELRKRA